MGVTLLNKPNRNCLRHIVSAQGLLLCRDESYRVSPHEFALLFSRLCDEVSEDNNGIRWPIPARNEIEEDPKIFAEFLVSRALGTRELGQIPKELLYALAQSYLAVGFEDDLADVGAFIRSCLNGIPQNGTVAPIRGSCRIATIECWRPYYRCFGRAVVREELVIEEQCDFKIKEEHTGHEDYPRVRLRVRYRVESSKKLETLYHLSVRKVGIELIPGVRQESSDHILSRCSWNEAHKQIKKFYVARSCLRSDVPVLSLNKWRLQPRNKVYFTHKVVWRASNNKDLIETLLIVSSSIAHDKLHLTHGRTQVDKVMDQRFSEMYYVKHCAVIHPYGSAVFGVVVRYTIFRRNPSENVRLYGLKASCVGLQTGDSKQYIQFLSGDLCDHVYDYVFTTETGKAVTCRNELLEDIKRRHNIGDCDIGNQMSAVPSSDLTISHTLEAVHCVGRGGGVLP
ncbi:hypothetical protein [Candidatus Anaplasma sp. TIGMIC]|uniref:hypothetical protein n=1 Tax=Candidatus Anaplasma sp. TIGMIC TaxID=3020713 RepID=UPI0023308F14|nr:hypothetical protein [Candidatus Anaplasma sp. TIGMIC]MDB1135556.1 hypothetical protein [Candidatus Anaplasma sp. TIGMIC]